jgi:hypothetical protein
MPPRYPPRRYDRAFGPSWGYNPEPRAPSEGRDMLVPIEWDGLPLNIGDAGEGGFFSVIENVEGWLDSPPVDGNDAARSIADGSVWGPKTLGARTIVLHGVVAGPRAALGLMRNELAARTAKREPAPLSITDGFGLSRTLTADVRAGSEGLRHAWLSPSAFRWEVTLTAADPLLYGPWESEQLSTGTGDEDTGREYQREFGWTYGQPFLPNTALLANPGNADAQVFALYHGDLIESRMTDDLGGVVRMVRLEAGEQVRVATATLTAEGPGGVSRANYILPGSQPMLIPAGGASRWHLYSGGYGHIELAWRAAWV